MMTSTGRRTGQWELFGIETKLRYRANGCPPVAHWHESGLFCTQESNFFELMMCALACDSGALYLLSFLSLAYHLFRLPSW